jgi:hypothetical protein
MEIKKRDLLIAGATTIPRAKIQVFVYAEGRWHFQGDATLTGKVWHRTCWFGDQSTMSGTFPVVAIADADIDTESKNLIDLPNRGTRSEEITIKLKRQPKLSDLG